LDDRYIDESPAASRRSHALATVIKPLLDAADDEWVVMVGRYVLNMGAVEMATRLIIARLAGTDTAPIFSDDLSTRIGFIRKRFRVKTWHATSGQ